MKLKIHEFANIFPMMSEDEYRGLVEDIRANGQREPIWTHEGKVIDGRNRLRACEELGVVPLIKEYQGTGSVVEFIVSLNLHRRSLTASQRAAISPAVKGALAVEAKARQKAAGGDKKSPAAKSVRLRAAGPIDDPSGYAREQAAKIVGVGHSYVSDAEKVQQSDPELLERVRDGKVTLPQAKREIQRRERKEALEAKAAAVDPADAATSFRINCCDCIEGMKLEPPRSVRLVIADPPYNIGVDYGDGPQADQLDPEEFLDWSESWMLHAYNLLSDDGSMFVVIPDEWADEYGCLLRKVGLHRRRWIKWYETFGVNQSNNYNRTSRHIFYMVKDPRWFVFNPEAVTRESDRQAKYGDKRANPGGKLWDDVWIIPRLVGNAAERVPDVPTQLPLDLLRPIVLAHSDPGDVVLDPFSGSGSTGVACVESGRRFVGIEKNPHYAEQSRLRLAASIPQLKVS